MNNNFQDFIKFLSASIKGTVFENHTYLVGGALRDYFMHKNIHDFDIVVDIENGGNRLANYLASQDNSLVLGNNPSKYKNSNCFGLTLRNNEKFKDLRLELSTTRKRPFDRESVGTIYEDARLRDLSINAMYLDITNGEMIDPCNGMEDMCNQLLQCGGYADTIFQDDPLRMMRIIRFAAKYQWGIEKDTWFSIIKNRKLINNVLPERIVEEFNKILLTITPSYGLERLLTSGLLSEIMPEAYALNHIGDNLTFDMPYNVWKHTLETVDCTDLKLVNRLAAFFHDFGKAKTVCYRGGVHFFGHETEGVKIVEPILQKYKYSQKTIDKVLFAVRNHERFSGCGNNISHRVAKKFMIDCGDNLYWMLDFMKANAFATNGFDKLNKHEEICRVIGEIKDVETIKLPINGNDVMEKFNLKEGAIIRTLLNAVKEKIPEYTTMSKEDAFNIIEQKLKIIL